MGIRQVEKLYKKVIDFDNDGGQADALNPGVRAEIFQKIMDDVERLMKKLKKCDYGSDHYYALDNEIRQLLLKEIQVIIDDYMLACRNGTVQQWERMYGDIQYYRRQFYLYRDTASAHEIRNTEHMYGFYDQEQIV